MSEQSPDEAKRLSHIARIRAHLAAVDKLLAEIENRREGVRKAAG